MRILLNDIHYALRIYRKNLGNTLLAVVMLAIGIGSCTAVFTVINTILLKPLPYPQADRIAIPWRKPPAGIDLGYKEIPWGLDSFHLIQRDAKSFRDLGAFKSEALNLTGTGDPLLVQCVRASAGFFETFGIMPELGRVFTSEEDLPGRGRVAVLSHQLWQERFNGNPQILGSYVNLNGSPYAVIGIMPAGFSFPRGEEMPGSFSFPRRPDLWLPLAASSSQATDAPDDLAIVGRLNPGVTMAQVQDQMNILAKRMDSQSKGAKGWFSSRIVSLSRQVQSDIEMPLLLIFGAVGLVLLITCSNVANLVLARSIERKTEFTLRTAMGAKPRRLVLQLLTESIFLSAPGGILGALFAYISIHFIRILGPANVPRLQEIELDGQVLAFIIAITFMCGILFGLAPVISLMRNNIAESLKGWSQRSGGGATSRGSRNLLMILEVAFAVVLVVAAGLMGQTFLYLSNVDGGFNTERVISFKLSLPGAKYAETNDIVAAYQRILQTLKSEPGIESSGIIRTVPLTGATEAAPIRVPGRVAASKKDRIIANYNIASPGYFPAIGTPVLNGRDFLDSDSAESMPVVIINSALAKKAWPDQSPIGRQLGLGSPNFPLMTVIGVVADVKHLSLREIPGPEMYVPYTQKPYPSMSIMSAIVRTKGDSASAINTIQKAIHSVDGDLPVADVATMTQIKNDSLTQTRFSMLLLSAFAILAMLLACLGMYGVISYSVAQRTREIGIRIALGARRGTVFGMVLGSGARTAGIGIAIGLLVALLLTRTMVSFLYGVRATDPFIYAAVSLLLMGVALMACYVPAHRATRVDPLVALRYE